MIFLENRDRVLLVSKEGSCYGPGRNRA